MRDDTAKCKHCGWTGTFKELDRGYKGFPIRGIDVEMQDLCPKCGNPTIDLESLEDELIP